MTTTKKYRMIGTTDEVVECEKCGKVDLSLTVVLEFLDADGNGEGVTYYGTTCAARALADRGVRLSAASVVREARSARHAALRECLYATEQLDAHGLAHEGAVTREETCMVMRAYIARCVERQESVKLGPDVFKREIEGWRSSVALAERVR